MKLTAANVNVTLLACLYEDNEIEAGAPKPGIAEPILVYGLMNNVGMNSARVAEQTENIKSLLDGLPDSVKTADGVLFQDLCIDRDSNQWGEHRNMNELVMLGIAANIIQPLMPRMTWFAMPGGLPPIFFEVKEQNDTN